MIVRPDKTHESNSLYPNSNWYENEPENYIIDETTEEGAALAAKVVASYPFYNIVLDDDGNLIDVEPYEPSKEEYEAIYPPREPTETEVLGQQLVDRELEALELRTQNEVLGGQIVEKELQILDLQAQNDALGASLVGMELRLLELEGVRGDV